ncbi:hypothetical protein EOPP23_06290 [Endozoicomonas sp. OPT23]|nr:hypothetical protein [Endozoicomonas sp. OPT23]
MGALAAAVSATMCAGVSAEEKKELAAGEIKTVFPVGPMYDPDFDFAITALPTLLNKFDDDSSTSWTRITAVYGSTGNKNIGLGNDWYFGGNKFNFKNYLGYTDINFTEQDYFYKQGLQDVDTVMKSANGSFAYQILDNVYAGVSWDINQNEIQRKSGGDFKALANNLPDNDVTNYGFYLNYDDRNHKMMPTEGMFLEANLWKVKREATGGADSYCVNTDTCFPLPAAQSPNQTYRYETVKLDGRYYKPLSEMTTFASRLSVLYNTDEAPNTAANLSRVAQGFSREVLGRGAVAVEGQYRHWFNSKWGVVGGLSLAKALDANDSDKDGMYYAGTLGLRYMLVPESNLALRVDLTQSNQEEEGTLLYFRVGESF